MADGSTKLCPHCLGDKFEPCFRGAACSHCRNLGDVGLCFECEGKGAVLKTDRDLEAEGQLNLLDNPRRGA